MGRDPRRGVVPADDGARWGLRLAWAVAFAGLVLLAGFTAWLGLRALTYPYQLLYGEGFLLEFTRRLAAGEPLYKPLADFPLGTCNYPPLSLLLARLLLPLTGLAYAAGRAWSLLAAVAVAALVYAWVRRASGKPLPAAAVALAWLGAPYVYHWAPQFRVDLPGLAFSLAGVYLVWRTWGSRWVYAAAPLFVAGLYCKQSFLAAPAAVLLALLASRHRRQAPLLAGLILALGGVPFLLLSLATRGAFWDSMVTANVNQFHADRLAGQLLDFGRTYLPLLLLAGACLVDGARSWRALAGPERLTGLYVLLALLTMGLAGKAGSWENYFLEPLAAVCLAAGLGLAGGRWKALRWLGPVLLAAQVALMWHTPAQAARQMRADAAANRAVAPQVAAAPGLVLSEDAGLLVQAGKPVPYYDFQLTQLALAGRWDPAWETDALRRGDFSLIILEDDARIDIERYGRFTRAFMSALDLGYRPAERVGKYRLYRPAALDRERPVRLSQGLALVGHTLPPVEVRPAQALSLDLVWQATRPLTETYTSFVHLVDAGGRGFAGDDRQAWAGLYPTPRWAEGEMVRLAYTLTLPAELPAGLYTLRAGWYDAALNRLLTEQGADAIPLAVVVVPPVPGLAAGPVPAPLDVRFEGGIRLVDYAVERQAGALRLELTWVADRPVPVDYVVFVHLLGGDGQPAAQGDGPPLGGTWPTSLWPVGYRLRDPHLVPLPAGLAPGMVEWAVGLYDPVTGRRLPLEAGGDAVSLGPVRLP